MTIQYASDLHLEFDENSRFLLKNPILPVADILILAGDIGYLEHYTYSDHPFWDWASYNFKQVLITLGNHEFYSGYDVENIESGAVGEIRNNIHWYYNKSVVIGDIEFIMTPLWSYIPPGAERIVEGRISDFRCIRYHNKKLKVHDFNKLHSDSLTFLKNSLIPKRAKKVVCVTHHLPSLDCMAKQFKGDILGSAFVSEQYNLIEESCVNYWIYGHSHRNIDEITIGRTKLVSNQLGYVNYNEHLNFKNISKFVL